MTRARARASGDGALEAGDDRARHVDAERPLRRRLEAPAPGREPDAADRAPVAVRRLPVEPATLEVGELGREVEQQRRPLAVEVGVPRARARDEPARQLAR